MGSELRTFVVHECWQAEPCQKGPEMTRVKYIVFPVQVRVPGVHTLQVWCGHITNCHSLGHLTSQVLFLVHLNQEFES